MRCLHFMQYLYSFANWQHFFSEPIHEQKHSNDPFYQKEPSLYDDLEDSYSYSNYDTGLYPENDDLQYSHHPQCNHPGKWTSYLKPHTGIFYIDFSLSTASVVLWLACSPGVR